MLLVKHIVLFILAFTVYAFLYNCDKKHFSNAKDYYDMVYFTCITHSTVGYGDIVPTSTMAKMAVSLHVLLVILITIEFISYFTILFKHH